MGQNPTPTGESEVHGVSLRSDWFSWSVIPSLSRKLPVLRLLVMRRLLVIALALTCAAGITQARLNETEQEFETRYGKPTETSDKPTPGSDKTLSYTKNGVRITAEFVKGRCQKITYVGVKDQQQLDAILKANGGPIWAPYKGGGKRKLVRSDGLAIATILPDDDMWTPSMIVFTLNEWQKAHDKAIKDADAASQAAEKVAKEKSQRGF